VLKYIKNSFKTLKHSFGLSRISFPMPHFVSKRK
jgi:hypothetical protein